MVGSSCHERKVVNRKTRLITLSLSVIAMGCGGEHHPLNKGALPDTQIQKDQQFLTGMMSRFDDPEITGLAMLNLAYEYCGRLVEGSTLDEVYGQIELLDESERSLHQAIVDMAINTICVSDSGN